MGADDDDVVRPCGASDLDQDVPDRRDVAPEVLAADRVAGGRELALDVDSGGLELGERPHVVLARADRLNVAAQAPGETLQFPVRRW